MATSTSSTFHAPIATIEARIAALAARQVGAVGRSQVLELGLSETSIRRRLRSGAWARVHPGVYRVSAVPSSWLTEVWCALLAAGPTATVTHETAVRLHGCELVQLRPITLTVPHGAHARVRGAVVHQIDDLRPHNVMALNGLPVSMPDRAVVELAATTRHKQLGRVLNELVHAKRTSYELVGARLHEVIRPGKPGVVTLGRVLDEQWDGPIPPASELERALFAALDAGGLPRPRRQMALPSRGAIEGLVDAAYPDCRLILESDGRRWHARINDLKRDHERDAEAARVGWQTLRFVYEQIVHDPHEVCAVVADVRAVRSTAGPPRQREAIAAASGLPR